MLDGVIIMIFILVILFLVWFKIEFSFEVGIPHEIDIEALSFQC